MCRAFESHQACQKTAPQSTVFDCGACFFVVSLARRTHRCVSNRIRRAKKLHHNQPYLIAVLVFCCQPCEENAQVRLESHQACHVGTSYACSDFLCYKKSVTHSTVPPFRKKVPLDKAARLYCTRQPCHR